jgi:hypothetical protein
MISEFNPWRMFRFQIAADSPWSNLPVMAFRAQPVVSFCMHLFVIMGIFGNFGYAQLACSWSRPFSSIPAPPEDIDVGRLWRKSGFRPWYL